jgi:lipid-A-disaccharide synthase
VHFVSPSIWAWRAERIEKIRRSVDHVLCIFPFEPECWRSTALPRPMWAIRWPRDPLVPDRAAARAQLGLDGDTDTVVAILPGSRRRSQHIAPRFFQAAALMQRRGQLFKFIVPAVPGLRAIDPLVAPMPGLVGAVQIVTGQSHTVLAACDVTLIASGTATLEAALFKRPMVIAYHMHWLSGKSCGASSCSPGWACPTSCAATSWCPSCCRTRPRPRRLRPTLLAWLDDAARL